MKRIALALTALLALVNVALAGSSTPPNGPFTPPNTTVACGRDGTVAIQAALNNAASNNGIVSLPPCPFTNSILISATLNIPSNTALTGAGRGLTWLKEADAANLVPMIQNSNAAGAASIQLNTNIEISNLSIDGNGANQNAVLGNKCISLLGVAEVSIHDVEVKNCRATAILLNGNGAPDTLGSNPSYISSIYINGVVGSASGANNTGLAISNRQRNAIVSDVFVENPAGYGVLIDASEGSYTNIQTKGAGTGFVCANSGGTTVDNPGGGGVSQTGWVPCPAGIYFRNVTNVNASNLVAHQGQYYGIVIAGTRHSSISNITATQNSLKTTGTWDDLHIDYNPLLPGYGENHALSIVGAVLGANGQTTTSGTNSISPPTSRYGLFINDGQAGSVGDAQISNAGTGYTVSDLLTCSGGTFSEVCKFNVGTAPGGVITGLNGNGSAGWGVYTVLPANPVSLTGGTGASASVNITWSTAYLTGIMIGQCVTAKTRTPAFITNWTVQTSAGNFGP